MRTPLVALFALFCAVLAAVHSEQCSNLPGIEYILLGFDAVQGVPMSLPLFNLSCSQGQTWTAPFSGQSFMIPDLVSVVSDTSYTTDSRIFRSASDFAQYLGYTVGLDLGYGSVFSGNTEVSSARSSFDNQDGVLSYFRQELSLYALALPLAPTIPLDSNFAAAIEQLPAEYNETAYSSFIITYGTHAITACRLGGLATSSGFVSNEYQSDSGGNEVTASLNARLTWFAQAHAGAAYNFETNSEAFSNSGSMQWNAAGGTPAYASASEWALWVNSLPSNPAPITFSLLPLASLITPTAKAANFEQAVAVYLAVNNHSSAPEEYEAVPLEWCNCYETEPASEQEPGTGELFVSFPSQPDQTDQPFIGWGMCEVCAPSFQDAFGTLATEPAPALPPRRHVAMPPRAHTGVSLPLLAGLDSLGVGYDVVYGRLRYLPLLNFTFYHNNTFSDASLGVPLSLYPDQVYVEPTTDNGATTNFFTNAQQLASFYSASVGVDVDLAGAFALHWDVQSSSSAFERSLAAMVYTQEQQVLYEATVYETQLQASPEFLLAVNNLPETYEFAAYNAFVQTYGTHVITKASYGGMATMRTWISQQAYGFSDQDSLQANAYAVYELWKAGAYVNDSSEESLYAFNSASFSEATLQGGNVSAYDLLHHLLWSQSIPLAPAQISVSLSDINDLVSDPARSKNLQFHILSYISNHSVSPATTMEPPEFVNNEYTYLSINATCPPGYFLTNVPYLGGGDIVCNVNCGWTSWGDYQLDLNCQSMSGDEPCPENQFAASFAWCYSGFMNNYARFPLTCCSIRAYY